MDKQLGSKTHEADDRVNDLERNYILLPGHSEYSGRFRFISEEEPPRGATDNAGDTSRKPAEEK